MREGDAPLRASLEPGFSARVAKLRSHALAMEEAKVTTQQALPLLFSEAVDLHPVAIIVAILVFGGLWGFWGVFFAIPLATLVQAVISAWPKGRGVKEGPDAPPLA